MSAAEKGAWKVVKAKGRTLFDPLLRGSYEVFNVRPMTEEIRKYCVQDVLVLPGLFKVYFAKLSPFWMKKVRDATWARVELSQSATYKPNGRHKARGPWGEDM